MRNTTFIFVCSLFCVIFLSAITQAQNSRTHNTGTLEVTIIDNGYIEDDGSGTYGGIVFNGNPDACLWICSRGRALLPGLARIQGRQGCGNGGGRIVNVSSRGAGTASEPDCKDRPSIIPLW